jgi:hypothetical protein
MTTNEAFVRDSTAAFNSGDREAWLAFIDPDARFYPVEWMPDFEAVFEGLEGFASFWDRFREPWDQLRAEIERMDDDGEVVALDMRWVAGRAGAPPIKQSFGVAIKVHDGLCTLMVAAPTGADARDKLLTIAPEPAAS